MTDWQWLCRAVVSCRVWIVGGGGLNPHSSCLQTLIFEWKLALNFNPWVKLQTFRHLTPSSFLLGQFQHWFDACFWQLLSSFCQLRKNFDDGRPSTEEHPRWQVNRIQIRLFGGVWLSELKVLMLQVLCFWRCEREHRPAALTICNGHISSWCRVASLCQAINVLWCPFPPGWMKTTSACPMRDTATDTVALRLEYSHSHYQTSGVDVFLESSRWVNVVILTSLINKKVK